MSIKNGFKEVMLLILRVLGRLFLSLRGPDGKGAKCHL